MAHVVSAVGSCFKINLNVNTKDVFVFKKI